jgi:polyphosphate kinase
MTETRPPMALPAILAALLVLAPSAASAHPHVFIDGGVDFMFDGEGRIESLRVTWI